MLTKSLLLAGLAMPSQILGRAVFDSMPMVPVGFTMTGEADANTKISLKVELTLSNIDKMVENLYAVSTPGNAAYGQHWSKEKVNDLVAPSDEAVQATVGWLNSSGISDIAVTQHTVLFSTTVAKANKLLSAKFSYYEKDGVKKLRTQQYSVGAAVEKHIDLIHPTTFLGDTKTQGSEFVAPVSLIDANCSSILTPACTKELYNIPASYAPKNNAGASIAFGSFLGQTAQEADQLAYETRYGIANQTFDVILIDGAVDNQNTTIDNIAEANLDAQNIIGVAHPLPLREYITPGYAPFLPDPLEPLGSPSNEPYLEYYTYLLSLSNQELPQVITNSYGDEEQSVPPKYAVRTCNLMGMMGLRGITIFESSGDEGVGASCRSSSGNKPQFNPIFPATCPYITAVGGTAGIPEVAWEGSSGGFSNIFPRAYYQETAVNTYIDTYILPSTAIYLSQYTNFSGRAFPDVSALGGLPGYIVYYNGKRYRNYGTSASSPVWAGIAGLLNDARLSAGKPSLGFLNPWIYSAGYKALKDITEGQTIGCNGYDTQSGEGVVPGAANISYATWNATKGWDPTTGWGVPNFVKLRKAVLAM